LKLDVALFSRGGSRVLDEIEKQGYDVLSHRPTVSKTAKTWLMLSTTVRLRLGLGV
jgi:phytoene/squalene synthetase